jgi:hypothetical protein
MRTTSVLLTVMLAGAGWWALAPASIPASAPEAPNAPAPQETPALTALDAETFRAPLWVAPPAPAAAAVQAAPPPLKLQLLAIVRETESFKAMLYDPDTDKLLVVAEGEQVGGRRVERVTASGVQIRDGSGLRTLALRSDGGVP